MRVPAFRLRQLADWFRPRLLPGAQLHKLSFLPDFPRLTGTPAALGPDVVPLEAFVTYLRSCQVPLPVPLIHADRAESEWRSSLQHAALAVLAGECSRDHKLEVCDTFANAFCGLSPEGERVTILERISPPVLCAAPPSFKVVAIIPVFNEEDVIGGTLQYLIADGIAAYVVDNWSTDATLDIVRQYEGQGLLGWERFPSDADAGVYDLRGILGRVECLAERLDADWFMLHDADERRRAPWRNCGLHDALYRVDCAGFTAVDHVTLNFWPTNDEEFSAECDPESAFPYFEFSAHPGHFHQRRAWKNLGAGVSLAPSAGHDVGFFGRRVYPFKFLLKHYPIRSREHGRRKVLEERRSRFSPAERALGWHQQYDALETFTRAASDLDYFDPSTFYEERLLERLSGVGVFEKAPDWATPPIW